MSTTTPPGQRVDVAAENRWRVGITLIVAGGLLLRLIFVLVARSDAPAHGDGIYYHLQANLLADGHLFIEPFLYENSAVEFESAHHPPLYTTYLAFWSFFGLTSVLAHRVVSTFLGALAVFLIGLCGRRISGDRVGLIAAGLAALYPGLWVNDTTLHSEGAFIAATAAVILGSYRLVEQPTMRRTVALGALIAVAALGRAEALLLVPLLGLPLALRLRRPLKERIALFSILAATTTAVVAPWILFNLSRFEKPVTMSSGTGAVLAQGNCDNTYYGGAIGYWDFRCFADQLPSCFCNENGEQACWEALPDQGGVCYGGDESALSAEGQEVGLAYISDNLGRVPLVMSARVGRALSIYKPFDSVNLDTHFEKRGRVPSLLTLYGFWALGALGIWGLVILHREKTTIIPFVSIAAASVVTTAIAFGVTRFRVGIDVVLVLAAAVAIDHLVKRLTRSAPASSVSA